MLYIQCSLSISAGMIIGARDVLQTCRSGIPQDNREGAFADLLVRAAIRTVRKNDRWKG
jgi:hypothetical protein